MDATLLAVGLGALVGLVMALTGAGGAMLALPKGRLVAGKLHPAHLQQAFAWFTLAIAVLMLARAFGLALS